MLRQWNHDLVRQLMHRILSQCAREKLQISFADMLAEAMLAKNCLFQTGQVTPYEAVYGRRPPMLPESESPGIAQVDNLTGTASLRHVSRLREIALQHMVESTAQKRMRRADNARSAPAGQQLQLQLGDLVDI